MLQDTRGINNPRYQLILEENKNIWYHFIILVLANSLLVWPSNHVMVSST